jgi:hypothetical protein
VHEIFDWLAGPEGAAVVSSYATAAGVLVALAFGLRAELRARADERERRATALRAQARHVAAWLEPAAGARPVAPNEVPPAVDVVIHNGSPQPIYWASVWVPGTGAGRAVGVVAPGTTRFGAHEVPRLLRGDEKAHDLPTVAFMLSFGDSAGHGWTRTHEGALRATKGEAVDRVG